jgi:hypothetical protein
MKNVRINILEKIAKQVEGNPPAVNLNNLNPNLIKILGPGIFSKLTAFSQYLNVVLYFLSEGKYNFEYIFRNISSIDSSNIYNKELKNILEFCKQLFSNTILINNSSNFKSKIINLENSQNLSVLSDSGQTGQISSKLPSGSIKSHIKKYLLDIKSII